MLKHYVEFFYPGSFLSETGAEEVPHQGAPVTIPARAFGYRYFSRNEVTEGSDRLLGPNKDHTPMTYIGEVMTLDQVKALGQKYEILVSNMEINKWPTVVKTRLGNFQPLNAGDTVLPP